MAKLCQQAWKKEEKRKFKQIENAYNSNEKGLDD